MPVDTKEESTSLLVERDGTFYVYQPGLALIASGQSLAEAYGKFSTARREFLKEAERAGFLDVALAVPSSEFRGQVRPAEVRDFVSELGLFLAKMCIVLILTGGIVGAAVVAVMKSVDHVSSAVSSSLAGLSIVDVANKVALIAQDVQAMPADRKEALRQSMGVLSREFTPMFDAWRDRSAPEGATKQ
jgi:hypothetical protein